MLFAFFVALVPAVYGAACGPCTVVEFYDQAGKSTDCDFDSISLDCDQAASIKQGAQAWKMMCEDDTMADAFQNAVTTGAKMYQDMITNQGLDCDAISNVENNPNDNSVGASNTVPNDPDCKCQGTAYESTPCYNKDDDTCYGTGNMGDYPNDEAIISDCTTNAEDQGWDNVYTCLKTDDSAAAGIQHKVAVVVSAAFAYLLF